MWFLCFGPMKHYLLYNYFSCFLFIIYLFVFLILMYLICPDECILQCMETSSMAWLEIIKKSIMLRNCFREIVLSLINCFYDFYINSAEYVFSLLGDPSPLNTSWSINWSRARNFCLVWTRPFFIRYYRVYSAGKDQIYLWLYRNTRIPGAYFANFYY